MQIAWFDVLGPTEEGRALAVLWAAVMRVFSAGHVRLRSDDPLDDPIVDFCFLSDERDLVRLRDGVNRMIDIVQRPSMRAIAEEVTVAHTPIEELTTIKRSTTGSRRSSATMSTRSAPAGWADPTTMAQSSTSIVRFAATEHYR